MTFVVYNGSYISNQNTGLGVVSNEIYKCLDKDNYFFARDKNSGNFFKLPSHLKRQLWLQFEVPKLLKKLKPEFFLSPIPESPIFSKTRKVVFAHDLIPIRFPNLSSKFIFYSTYLPLILHNSELVLCNSKATANELNSFFKIPSKKLEIIPLGINHKEIYPIDVERKNFILVLGRHDKHKNLFNIIAAISKLKNCNFKVIFAGPFKDHLTKNLLQAINDFGLSNKCEFKSWISTEEKLILLNSCKALLIPSLWEGFGLPAIEAMACGTPVIASNRGALKECLGDYGIYIDPLNPDSIASAMEEVLLNVSLLNYSQNSGPINAKRFNWQNTASKIDSLLRNRI